MDIEQAYTDWSATYDHDQNRTRDLDASVAGEMLSHVRCDSILEIGCGTGKNTELLARIGQQVQALDFSSGMIEKARQKVLPGNVIFKVADLTQTWPVEDQSIDLVVCNLVLEHVSDLAFIFSEASRVLRHGGRFFVSELHPYRQYQGTRAKFQSDQGTTEITAFVHHISDFIEAGTNHNLGLSTMKEWWHQEDQDKPPRLVSFMFEKEASG